MLAFENVQICHCLAYCSNFPNASSGSTEIPVELGVSRTLGEGLGEGLARELPDSRVDRREGKGEGMARAVVIGGNAGGAWLDWDGRGREERAAVTGGNGGGACLDPGTGKGAAA
jgi:hypothetical protein